MSRQVETGHVEAVSQPAPSCHLLHELVDNVFVFFSTLFYWFSIITLQVGSDSCNTVLFLLMCCLVYEKLDYLSLAESDAAIPTFLMTRGFFFFLPVCVF